MNDEKDEYKGLYYGQDNLYNENDEHNFEYGAHFKYEELYKILYDIINERKINNNNINKKRREHGKNTVLKGVSRNKINNKENYNGENISKNMNDNSLSKSNKSFKSASFNKINERKIKNVSDKNTISNVKNTRTILRNVLLQNIIKKMNNNNIFTHQKIYNSKNSSSNEKLNKKLLNIDKSSKSMSLKSQSRNLSTSKKRKLNNTIFQLQNNKFNTQIKNYFNQKYSKLSDNGLDKKLSNINNNTYINNKIVNKKKSIPISRDNHIIINKKKSKNAINILDNKLLSKNLSTQSLSNNDNNNINQSNNKKNANKSTYISGNIYYNTIQTNSRLSEINLLNISYSKEKIKPEKIFSIILNKKEKKRIHNLSSSKEKSSINSSIKHSYFPSNKTGSTMNSSQKGKNKIKQKMNKPLLV